MSYTLFAIGWYIVMRALQVLLEDRMQRRWCRVLIKTVTLLTLYAALASLVIWYKEIPLLGFNPGK